MRSAATIGVLCLLGVASADADQGEFTLAAQPGAAVFRLDREGGAQTLWGGGGGIDVAYGLADSLALRATGSLSAHPTRATATLPGGTALAYHAGLGLSYSLDILRVVPYLDFSFGLLGTRRPAPGGDQTANEFGLEVGLGVDYLVTRRVSVGVVARYHAFLTAITEIPLYFYFGPRVALRFGG